MSRYFFNPKKEAEEFQKIDIRELKKKGYLTTSFSKEYGRYKAIGLDMLTKDEPEWEGYYLLGLPIHWELLLSSVKPYLRLKYTTNKKEKYDYKIYLTTTECNLGSVRYWFLCPKCGRRVGVLYLDGYFLCRHCLDLTYKSCNNYGIWKKIGNPEELREPRVKYFKGKMTRKYKRYIEGIKKLSERRQLLYMCNIKGMTVRKAIKTLEYLYPEHWGN